LAAVKEHLSNAMEADAAAIAQTQQALGVLRHNSKVVAKAIGAATAGRSGKAPQAGRPSAGAAMRD
jgi:hypothetical protein